MARILVSGASGLIGSALVDALRDIGHEVVRLTRDDQGPAGRDVVVWDPMAGELDIDALEGIDAAVHLAGEPIAGRWSLDKMRRIVESRRRGTRVLSHALAALDPRPQVLISASGINYYGDRCDELLDEQSDYGDSFLAGVCREWESATEPAAVAGIRVVNLRLGMVLSAHGGALARLLLPFRLGLGGPLGSGRQYWSWVTLDDVVSVILFALETETLSGPINVCAPAPVHNREFSAQLGHALGRPARLRLPAWVLRAAMGEMGRELLLSSLRVAPMRLAEAGFRFAHPEIGAALVHVLREE